SAAGIEPVSARPDRVRRVAGPILQPRKTQVFPAQSPPCAFEGWPRSAPSRSRRPPPRRRPRRARPAAAAVVDLATGEEVFSRNAGLSLAPASNEKLAVAYTALVELGPGYRFATSVLAEGRQAGSVWRGRLVLKGFGDPTLQTDDLKRLARRLHERGIRRVTGHVAGDGSWFDDRWTAPGWRPGFYGLESPPLSALVVNRGVRHRRLVRDPRLAAAALFDRILREQGIDA